MRILGIDPGFAKVGYGVVRVEFSGYVSEGFGVIRTSQDETLGRRFKDIYVQMGRIIDQYKPDEVAMESLFFGKNVKTGMMVAMSRGVLLLICEEMGKRVHEYGPLEIKLGVTGYGGARKEQVIKMIDMLLGAGVVLDDAADALGVAICHGNRSLGVR